MTEIAIDLTAEQRRAGKAIDALNLEPIAFKLSTPEPGEKGMPLAEADQLIAAYRSWLKLCAWYPGTSIVPSKAIDQVWHAHILDTAKYAYDCEQVFGHFMDHFPYFGTRGPDDAAALRAAYDRTQDLHRAHFGTGLAAGPDQSVPCDPGAHCEENAALDAVRPSGEAGVCSTKCDQGGSVCDNHGGEPGMDARRCVACQNSGQCHTGDGGSCRASAALDQVRPQPDRSLASA